MPDVLPFAAPQSSGGADLNPLLQQLLQRINGGGSTLQSNVVPIRQKQQEIQSQIADIQPAPAPEITPVPTQAPLASVTDPLKAMGSPMMLMALLGGALTGAPITSALQNATGFLEGIHKGDAEATKNHLDEFHANIDAAMKSNSAALEKYRAAMESKNFDLNKKLGEFRAVATEYGDPITMHAIETGDLEAAFKLIDARERNQQALQNHLDALTAGVSRAWKPVVLQMKDGSYVNGERNDITQGYRDAEFHDVSPAQVTQALSGPAATQVLTTGDLTPDNPRIKAIAEYKAPPGSMWGANTPYATKLMDAVLTANPKYDVAGWTAHTDVVNDFAKGMSARKMDSLNSVIQHFDVIEQAAVALKNGDTRALNALNQEFQKQFGSPVPTNFDALAQIVSQETNKVIIPGSTGGTAEERLAASKNVLTKAASLPQIIEGAEELKKLMAGQANAMRQRWTSTPGLDAAGFDAKLTPQALSALRTYGYEGSNPTLEQFLPKARLANPNASDDELTRFWESLYGPNRAAR